MARLKRKDVDQVSDDFSDFSLSSPATKIRRLDAELPPIAEMEEEPPLPIPPQQEESLNPTPNEERAIVLFKPFLHSPSSSSPFSLTLRSDLVSQIKDWSRQCDSDCDRLVRSQEEEENKKQHMALVPWVPSSYSHESNNTNPELMMEADEMGEASMMTMDIEQHDDAISNNSSSTSTMHPIQPATLTATPPEGFHPWHQQQQQQHCLLPQIPQNTSPPITFTWTR